MNPRKDKTMTAEKWRLSLLLYTVFIHCVEIPDSNCLSFSHCNNLNNKPLGFCCCFSSCCITDLFDYSNFATHTRTHGTKTYWREWIAAAVAVVWLRDASVTYSLLCTPVPTTRLPPTVSRFFEKRKKTKNHAQLRTFHREALKCSPIFIVKKKGKKIASLKRTLDLCVVSLCSSAWWEWADPTRCAIASER